MSSKYLKWMYRLIFLIYVIFYGTVNASVLDENCVVNILNRTIQVGTDGGWSMSNVPSNMGQVRARATCLQNGQTVSGQSDYFTISDNTITKIGKIVFQQLSPVPSSLNITLTGTTTLSSLGATRQLIVNAIFPDSSVEDVTSSTTGINYTSTNPAVASVTADGLVTALSSGIVLISARKDGVVSIKQLFVNATGDLDGDGIPDDYETANGLNPNDPVDAFEDQDNDGLSALEEFTAGTDVNNPDSDNDGINDKEELIAGVDGFITNPLLADSDGDGLNDAAEIAVGSSPVDNTDVNFKDAIVSLSVTPGNVVMTFNSVNTEVSTQLSVTGNVIDGTTLDLTNVVSGVSYSSSDLSIVSFGTTDGEIFGGSSGTATITVSYFDLRKDVEIVVETFDPVALSAISIPGYANNVDVSGDYAFVAAGAEGLQVVDVSDRSAPTIVSNLDTQGIAIDIKVVGNYAYIADGDSGLVIIDVSDPLVPKEVSTLNLAGISQDLIVELNTAYIATGNNGVVIVDVSNPETPLIKSELSNIKDAKGVDIENNLLVVVAGSSLHTIDVTDSSNPFKLGSINIGQVKDVAVKGDYAYVPVYSSGYKVVKLTNPESPEIVAGEAVIAPRDVALTDDFAFFAEQLFPNVVAYMNIQDPENTFFQGTINLSSFGDYAGTGIALDSGYAYITEQSYVVRSDYGSTGNTKLFIAQYRMINDNQGIAPQVTIDNLSNGDVVVENSNLIINAIATDDIAVAAVSFLIDGQVIFTDTTSPYQVPVKVPGGGSTITVIAQAIDLGNNTSQSSEIVLNVEPDEDNDGLGDNEEVDRHGTDPRDADSDDDGLNDGEEIARGTNPLSSDSDGDGLDDLTEINQQTDPLNPDITAPEVTQIEPVDGADEIAENSSIIVTFNEALLAKSVTGNSLVLTNDTVPVPGKIQLINNNTQILFKPDNLMSDYTGHEVTISNVRDSAGNPIAAIYISSFTTGNTVDTERPTIKDSSPQSNETDVPVNAILSVVISEPVDPSTVNDSSFYVLDTLTNQRVPGVVSVSDDKESIQFTPGSAFPVGRRHYFYLTSDIKDLFGNTFYNTARYFTTSLSADASAPEIDLVSFPDGQDNIATNAKLKVRFTEPVSALSLHVVTLTDSAGERVPANKEISSDHRVITLSSKLPFEANSNYVLNIGAVEDLSGNILASAVNISFLTGDGTDTSGGTVLNYSPASNSNAPGNVRIMVELSEQVDPTSLNQGSLKLFNTTTGWQEVAITHSLSADGRTITIQPDEFLDIGHRYYIAVNYNSYIYDLSGNRFRGVTSYFNVNSDTDLAPVVATYSSFVDGARDIAVNSLLQVEFNEALDKTCVNNSTVKLLSGSNIISGNATLASDQKTIIFTPDDVLSASTSYTLNIDGLCDYAGNSQLSYNQSFTTRASTDNDTTGAIVTITPVHNSTDIAVDTKIIFSFDEAINPATMDAISINISGIGIVPGIYSINNDHTVVTFTPDNVLPANYRIDLYARNVRDLAGNYTRGSYSTRFHTKMETDNLAPQVTLITPMDGSLDIHTSTPVILNFNEALDPSTINSNNFAFYANGQIIRPSVSRSTDSHSVTLTANLPANSVISVLATDDVKDLSGNVLADYISVFTTSVANDSSRPSVSTFYPGNGSSNVSADRSLVLYLNEAMAENTLNEAFKVSENGILINGTLNISANGMALEFIPDQSFAENALVQVFLDSTATDINGNALNNYQAYFRVQSAAANLSQVSNVPTGTISVSNPVIEARFNKALDAGTVSESSVYLIASSDWGNPVAAVTRLIGDRIVRIEPESPLEANLRYYIYYTTELQAVDGSAITYTSYYYYFRTSDNLQADTQSPLVAGMSPPEGAADVAVNSRKHVLFDEAMSTVSIQAHYSDQAVSVSIASGNKEVTVVPHSPLPENSEVTDTIDNIYDMSGNTVTPMSSTYTISDRVDRTAPVVVKQDPVTNASNVATNATFMVEYDERIDPGSVNSTVVYLRDNISGEHISGSVALDASGKRVSFVPDAALAVGRSYTFYNYPVYDLVGNYRHSTFSVTTSNDVDSDAPIVEMVGIEEGQNDIPTNVRLKLRFNEPVKSSDLDGIQLSNGLDNIVLLKSFSSDRLVLTLTPIQLLEANTNYLLNITGIQDLSGNIMSGSLTRNFITGAGSDLLAGTVSKYSPASNNVVPINTVIIIELSELVDPTSLSHSSLKLFDTSNDWADITKTYSIGADGRTITITPDGTLEPAHRYYYSVNYNTYLYDLSGNRFNSLSTYFTTE